MIGAAKPRYLGHLERLASSGRRPLEAFKLFCTMAACEVSLRRREDEYLEAVGGWKREELEVVAGAFGPLVEEMERRPHQDLLGPAYEVLGSPGDRTFRGEFYTPTAVADLAAELQLAGMQWPEGRPLDVLEPASGSGGMVLALVKAMAHRSIPPAKVRFECWDVAKTACDMAYVNLTLHGVPARIVWGNSLSGEVRRAWENPLWGGGGAELSGAERPPQDHHEPEKEAS